MDEAFEAALDKTTAPKELPKFRRMMVTEQSGITIVLLTDKRILDEENIRIIGKALIGLPNDFGRKKLILDFSIVEYMSSLFIGQVITLQKLLRTNGGKLVLCGIDPTIWEVFEITLLHKMFVTRKTKIEALLAFQEE